MSSQPSWKQIVLGVSIFYVIASSSLILGTLAHEYSHYVAHEGWEVAPIEYHATPSDAKNELIYVETVKVDGQVYRVENIEETTIVLYRDTFLYAFSLNLLPGPAYDTGSLAATYMHADGAMKSQLVTGQETSHWQGVMGAPLYVAWTLASIVGVWVALRANLFNRSLMVACAAELGNNAHHAADIGLHGMAYGFFAELLFGVAIVAAFALSPTYKSLLGLTKLPKGLTPQQLRFRHARPESASELHFAAGN